MKKANLVIGLIQLAFGLLFLFSIGTDIQFGFAVVLLTMGLKNLSNIKIF
jgi:hypothetical protein